MKNSNKLGKLFALSILTLTLSSCGGSAGGGGDLVELAALKVVATGTANEVAISWSAVAGSDGYNLYQSTNDLAGFTDPVNLATASPDTSTFAATATSTTVVLTGADPHYFVATTIQGGVESFFDGGSQAAATAHPLTFLTVAGGTTVTATGETLAATTWMDRNLGAADVATSGTDTMAYGDLYQWGRPADGHQLRTNTATNGSLAMTISPGHAEFITNNIDPKDWTAAGVDNDGAIRSEFWSRIDGSSICPTGFRVPTRNELQDQANSWSGFGSENAFASNLKWIVGGLRSNINGNIARAGIVNNHWSATVDESDVSRAISLGIVALVSLGSRNRAVGNSVRCIMN